MKEGQEERISDALALANYLPDPVAQAELNSKLRPLHAAVSVLAISMIAVTFTLPWIWLIPLFLLCALLGYRYYREMQNLQLHCGQCRKKMLRIRSHDAKHSLPGLCFACDHCRRKVEVYGSYNPD
ncbi:MAG: hypothetical protein H7A08_09580 [Oceanospirillaceae bacterium]|nr:hypothetical protein [Oceanospirillaceae bacterium]MCP5350858.1 hypothetical protein [Oceanospirillaceae bacterium]